MSLSPELKNRILASAASAPAPTRAQAIRSRAWLFSCGVVGALIIFFLEGGVRPSARPPSLIALTSVGTSAIVAVGIWLLFSRGRSMLRRPRWVLLGAALFSTVGFVAWRYLISAHYGLTAPWAGRVGYRCLSISIMTGALPLLGALFSWRRSDPVTPVSTGAAFGAGAGLGSALLIDLWCPVSYLPHLLIGHVLPIVVLAVLGALLGSKMLRMWRR